MYDMIESLTKLLRFASVEGEPREGAPFGEENRKALDFFLELGRGLGFSTFDADGYAGHVEYGTGDIVIGMLAHLDVVPAGSGWTSDPFEPIVRDGKIFARGAMDDKGPAIAALYAMVRIKEIYESRGEVFPAKIRLIVGCNEENGSRCIAYYKTKVDMPDIAFSPDSDFPVTNCEKGLAGFKLTVPFDRFCLDNVLEVSGGAAHNAVPDLAVCRLKNIDYPALKDLCIDGLSVEKKEGQIILHSVGKSAHSIEADKGDNAVWKIFAALRALEGGLEGQSVVGWIMSHLCQDVRGDALSVGFFDQISGGTIVNLVDVKTVNNTFEFLLDMRIPISVSPQMIEQKIMSQLPYGARLELFRFAPHLYMAEDSFLVSRLLSVYKKHTEDTEARPLTTSGGTYARTMPNCVAFGATMPDSRHNIHSPDEWISIEGMDKLVDIFADALLALADYKK